MKTYLVGEGKVGLLRSFMYCQSTLSLYHKTADRSSIYWSQCTKFITFITLSVGRRGSIYITLDLNPYAFINISPFKIYSGYSQKMNKKESNLDQGLSGVSQ